MFWVWITQCLAKMALMWAKLPCLKEDNAGCQNNAGNPNHQHYSTPPICIAMHLQCAWQYFRCPDPRVKGIVSVLLPVVSRYASCLCRNMPPVCIPTLLGKHWWGHRDVSRVMHQVSEALITSVWIFRGLESHRAERTIIIGREDGLRGSALQFATSLTWHWVRGPCFQRMVPKCLPCIACGRWHITGAEHRGSTTCIP